jgi:hypothetical protein
MNAKAYVLKGSEGGERLLVIRSADIDLLYTLVRRMGRMRDARLKELGHALEKELNNGE